MPRVTLVEAVRVGRVEQHGAGIERRMDDRNTPLVIPIGGGRQSHAAESDHSSGGSVRLLHELLHVGDELGTPVEIFVQSRVLPAKCVPRCPRFPAVDRPILRRLMRDALDIRSEIAMSEPEEPDPFSLLSVQSLEFIFVAHLRPKQPDSNEHE
jgi:hypothetical protein